MVDPMLTFSRGIWAATAAGLIGAMAAVGLRTTGPAEPGAAAVWTAVSILGALFGIPAGLFLRGEWFKKHWRGDAVEPAGYLIGHLWAWGGCLVPAAAGLVAWHCAGGFWPGGLAAPVSIGLLLVLRPDGRAMRHYG